MPWEHYTQEFAAADPKEIASRLSIPYDEETKHLFGTTDEYKKEGQYVSFETAKLE